MAPNGPARVAWLGCSAPLSPAATAALHPHTQVLAWDPDPDHAAKLFRLGLDAGLGNLAIHQDPAPPASASDGFDLVVVDSLIDRLLPPQRDLVVRAAVRLARPGALVCVTYRTEVGWGEFTPVIRLLRYVAGRADRDQTQSVTDAMVLLENLAERGVGYFNSSRPLVQAWLQELLACPARQVAADYLTGDLQPVSHAGVAEAMATAGATWVGHATSDGELADHGLAPAVEQELTRRIGAARSEVLRQSLTDIALRRSTRADLFRLGSLPITPRDRTNWLARLNMARYDVSGQSSLTDTGPSLPGTDTGSSRRSPASGASVKPDGDDITSLWTEDFETQRSLPVRRLWPQATPKQRERLLRTAMRRGLVHPLLGDGIDAPGVTHQARVEASAALTAAIAATHAPEHRWVVSPTLGTALPAQVSTQASEPDLATWGIIR